MIKASSQNQFGSELPISRSYANMPLHDQSSNQQKHEHRNLAPDRQQGSDKYGGSHYETAWNRRRLHDSSSPRLRLLLPRIISQQNWVVVQPEFAVAVSCAISVLSMAQWSIHEPWKHWSKCGQGWTIDLKRCCAEMQKEKALTFFNIRTTVVWKY